VQNQQSYDLSGRKLFIAIPSYDFKVSVKLAGALIKFGRMADQHGIEMTLETICGCSVVSRARNLLVGNFLETNCTDMLFIDSDMSINPDDITRLLAWSSTKNIVAGIACARKKQATYYSNLDQDENGCIAMDKMGLVRAKRVGTGFMMIQRQVLETLRDKHPEWRYYDASADKHLYSLFDFKSTPEGYIGEDYLLCDRAREEGFEVWIDPTIKIGHLGATEYEGNYGEDILYPMLKPLEENKEAA
jgi:hypothetical protein